MFDVDDCVVHDDAEGDDHLRQDQRIERHPSQVEYEQCADQGHWDRDEADQRGPPVVKKGVENQNRQHRRTPLPDGPSQIASRSFNDLPGQAHKDILQPAAFGPKAKDRNVGADQGLQDAVVDVLLLG